MAATVWPIWACSFRLCHGTVRSFPGKEKVVFKSENVVVDVHWQLEPFIRRRPPVVVVGGWISREFDGDFFRFCPGCLIGNFIIARLWKGLSVLWGKWSIERLHGPPVTQERQWNALYENAVWFTVRWFACVFFSFFGFRHTETLPSDRVHTTWLCLTACGPCTR